MRALSVLLVVVGCDKGKQDPRPVAVTEPAVVAVREADAMPLSALPVSSRAAIASPPRSNWPCAFDVEERQGVHAVGHSVFTYGKRTSCRLPLTLVAQGVWGCPDKFVRTDSDGMVRERTFEYDAEGRLLEYAGHMHHTFVWDGDRLVSTTSNDVDGPHTVEYRDRGNEIIGVEKDALAEVIELDDTAGVVVRMTQYLYGREAAVATLQWSAGRPQSIRVAVKGPMVGSVSRKLQYDCSQ